MKFKYTITFALLLIACTSNSVDANLASDTQRNWCYGAVRNPNYELLNSLTDAHVLYRTENNVSTQFSLNKFEDGLTEGSEYSLRVCKIWADMNNE